MDYTFTVNLIQLLWMTLIVVAVYVYVKDDGDDHLTQKRHGVEMRKEWFRMLAQQRVIKTSWPSEWGEKN